MKPYQLPNGHWIDAVQIQRLGQIQTAVDETNTEVCWFEIIFVFQPTPLTIEAARDPQSDNLLTSDLDLLRNDLLNIWLSPNEQPDFELTVDSGSIQDCVVHEEDTDGNTLIDLSYVVGKSPHDQQLLSFLHARYSVPAKVDVPEAEHSHSPIEDTQNESSI
jgi:hypothetical protein